LLSLLQGSGDKAKSPPSKEDDRSLSDINNGLPLVEDVLDLFSSKNTGTQLPNNAGRQMGKGMDPVWVQENLTSKNPNLGIGDSSELVEQQWTNPLSGDKGSTPPPDFDPQPGNHMGSGEWGPAMHGKSNLPKKPWHKNMTYGGVSNVIGGGLSLYGAYQDANKIYQDKGNTWLGDSGKTHLSLMNNLFGASPDPLSGALSLGMGYGMEMDDASKDWGMFGTKQTRHGTENQSYTEWAGEKSYEVDKWLGGGTLGKTGGIITGGLLSLGGGLLTLATSPLLTGRMAKKMGKGFWDMENRLSNSDDLGLGFTEDLGSWLYDISGDGQARKEKEKKALEEAEHVEEMQDLITKNLGVLDEAGYTPSERQKMLSSAGDDIFADAKIKAQIQDAQDKVKRKVPVAEQELPAHEEDHVISKDAIDWQK